MFKKIKENKYTPYVVIILLGIIICIPFFTLNLARTGEYLLHMLRIIGVKECISDGVFPPLISYKHMNGFGYGINIFYGIFTTYIPLLISYLTNSIELSIKICVLLSVIASGITMYWFVHNVTQSKLVGLISALLYMSAPYKLTNIYNRCAFGECVAFIFIPVVFYGLYYLINENKKGNLILILGASLLIFTHTITTIYTAIFAIIFLIFNYKKIINTFFWKNILIDVAIILTLTAVYTIPLLEHKFATKYEIFDTQDMCATPKDVYKSTNSPIEWIKVTPSSEFSFGIPIIFLMVVTIAIYKKVDIKYKKIYNTFWILSIISLVMSTKIFPWMFMPHFLTIIQFAWRLQGFFIFFISFICGINAYILVQELSKNKNLTIGIIIICIFICSIVNILNKFNKDDRKYPSYEKLVNQTSKLSVYNINRDYMPQKAYIQREWIENREDRTYIISGKAIITNENKIKLYDKMDIEVQEEAELELPYLYYLGYNVLLNGEKIKYYESDNGMICVKPQTSGVLEIKYQGTVLEKLGYVISLGGIIILIIYKKISEQMKKIR